MKPRIRILRGEEIAFGPGKADLLDAIDRTGTLRGGAAALGMSYMRAWGLVRTMNGCFRKPLVEATRGGTGHGTARLTPMGRRTLALYRRMERESLAATARTRASLVRLLRP